jgi:dCMP deaminase
MVGVLFLLQSDKKTDMAVIELLKKHNNFHHISLPELSLEDFKLAEEDPKKFEDRKLQILNETEAIYLAFKKKWQTDFVLYPVYFTEQLMLTNNRTYYLAFKAEIPILERFKACGEGQDLETYLRNDALLNFSFIEGFKPKHIHRFSVSKYNIQDLYSKLIENEAFNLFLTKDIRTELDVYFMNIAYMVRKRSNCMKRSVGCVIVKNKRIVSVGYNGCPQHITNCFKGGCERCNSDCKQGVDLHKCFCLHAEESAVLECGIHSTVGASLYCTLFPCLWCSKIIIHSVELF